MSLRSPLLALVISSLSLACGSGSPPPAQGPESTAAAAPAAEPAPAPAAEETPAAPAAGDEGWEGESAAKTGDAAPAGGAAPAPDSKKEETRTVEVLAKILKDNRKGVRDCYEKALKDLPTLKGDMVIHLVLDPEGKIKKIELNTERSTLKSPAVADCSIAHIKTLKFPPSSRAMETTMNYPYNLNPGGGG